MTRPRNLVLRGVPPSALAARVVILVAPVLALVATAVDGPAPRLVLLLAVLACSARGAIQPQSPLLTLSVALVVAWWGLVAGHDTPVLIVPAAWLLLAAHLAATLTSYGPRELPISADLARGWAPRALGLATVPPLLWLVATGVDDQPRPPGLWVAGAAVTAAVGVAAALAIRGRSAA